MPIKIIFSLVFNIFLFYYKTMQIIPTILTKELAKARTKLKKYQNIFSWVQLDITDGVFVANHNLTLSDFSQLFELRYFKIDLHLMVKEPLFFLDEAKRVQPQRIIGHIELMQDQLLFINQVKQMRAQTGLAVDLPTPLSKLEFDLLPQLDIVLLMSVKAGWGGQKFNPGVLAKIKRLAKIKKEKGLKFKIALDGGINIETMKKPLKEGVEIFYIGDYLFADPKNTLEKLKRVFYGQKPKT